jgi:beta-lactamase superfamily II metal-dependent hydrolase
MHQQLASNSDVWTFRDQQALGSNVMETHADISGFGVEAIDGSIGKVDDATYEAGGSYLVVDTGPWIFGKKVMIPAGVVRGIDETEEVVFVHRTKDQIKSAPEFDDSLARDEEYRNSLGMYYGPGGAGYRDSSDSF